MKRIFATLAMATLAAPVFAADLIGDPAVGEKEFRKCKSCHMIVADDGTRSLRVGAPARTFMGSWGVE